MPELIRPAEFARRKQVSRMAVSKAMNDGRLAESIVEKDGRRWLDAEIASQEWEANRRQMRVTDADKPPSKHAQHKVAKPHKRAAKKPAKAAGEDQGTDNGDGEPGSKESGEQQPSAGANGAPALGNAAYNQARAFREQYQARLSKLEYEEKAGRLIQAERVKIAQFKQGQQVREAVLAIPDRVATVLAAKLGAEVDPAVVHNVMHVELRNILQELAKHGRGSS